ncbi:phage tail assembly protein [Crenobacter caeni]|uniref:Phage tail assembly protein n=1 Tax=Crenobacter caeni TaxID=2705474 RepID=A0A6B2KN65_9NEIS|nr:phage tail assembly protein [Crenobacter caeni]NDV11676.1 phage tail assembly protein [Crenobacter caeni]
MSEVRIQLSVPIKAHGEEITELVLRKPSPDEAKTIGVLPYRMNDYSSIPDINISAACRYVSLCAGIPPSSVDQMDIADLNTACWAVTGFFWQRGSQT